MFYIFYHFLQPIVEQIRDFIVPEEFEVHCFPHPTELDEEEELELETFMNLNEADKNRYIEFLEKNAQRINKVTISIYGDQSPPYDFLGACLSRLSHIETIIISCIDFDEECNDPLPYFSGLGHALNQIPNPKLLKHLEMHLDHMLVEFGTAHEDFIYFLKACDPTVFYISSHYINTLLLDDIYNTIVEYPHLKHLSIKHSEPMFDPWDVGLKSLTFFGKLFLSRSVEELNIYLGGSFVTTFHDSYQSAEDQVKGFASQLEICSSLKELSLDFHLLCFNHEGLIITDPIHIQFSIDALDAISHNKTLEKLDLKLPSFCYIQGEQIKWAQFLQNFENSQLIKCDIKYLTMPHDSRRTISQEEIETIQMMADNITQENFKLKQSTPIMMNSLFATENMEDQHTIETYHSLSHEQRHKMDIRLFELYLRFAHFMNQKHHHKFSEDSIIKNFYSLYAEQLILFLPKLKKISDPNLIIQILAYLNQNDLSQLIELSPGILDALPLVRESLNIFPPLLPLSIKPPVAVDDLLPMYETNLNRMDRSGKSIAFNFASTPRGLSILKENDFHLAKRINEESLNATISEGYYLGTTLTFILALSAIGREILSLDNFRLTKLIDLKKLHPPIVKSLDDHLSSTSTGQKILEVIIYIQKLKEQREYQENIHAHDLKRPLEKNSDIPYAQKKRP